jgi:AcrR family transcriptional regulator
MPSETDRPAIRQDAILDAAFRALYLHYRSKEDIFKSLVAHYFEAAEANVAEELAKQGRSAAETLAAAFCAYDGKFMEIVLGTPHGAELLDAGHIVSADQVAAGEARIHAVLTKWLASAPIPTALGQAEDVASMLLASLKGLKSAAKSPDGYRASQRRLAQMLTLALGR